MKNIYIDGLALVEGHFSGIGQYILGILRGMDEIIDERLYQGLPVPKIHVVIPRNTVNRYKKYNFKHLGYRVSPIDLRYMTGLWHRGWLPPIDVWCGRGNYLFTRFVGMPLLYSKNSGLIIYDLTFANHTQYMDERNLKFLSRFVPTSIAKTNKVIAISKNVLDEINDTLKVPDFKLALAYPATDEKIMYRRSISEIEEVKEKYSISGNYILALSNLEPRKNLDALVEAYCQLPKSMRDDCALLLVGVTGWKTDELFSKILEKVKEGFNIIRPSKYVLDKDKPAIISGAKMLVYPSHYEGFGMPPLEALACGTPVICADNSSLPEVVGDAAKLVPSGANKALVDAMIDVYNNYDEIIKKATIEGPKQAKKFSWKDSAEVYLEMLSS